MDLENLKQFFEEGIPFNAFLGMRIERLEPGRCLVRIPFAPHMVGDVLRPALHGGVISTIADTAGGLAAFSALDPKSRVATVDLRIDYLRPGLQEDILCEAQVIRAGNRVAVSTMTVFHGDREYIAAEGRGVYNVVRQGD